MHRPMSPALTAGGRPALGFLFFVLALHSPSEVPNPLAEATAQLGDTARGEDGDDDDEYEEQLRKAETEHERLPPGLVPPRRHGAPEPTSGGRGSRITNPTGRARNYRAPT